jgi:hypothetical protein
VEASDFGGTHSVIIWGNKKYKVSNGAQLLHPIRKLIGLRVCTGIAAASEAFDMALPPLESVVECADFSKTVVPYISQLYTLPEQLLQSYNKPEELQAIYLATNPLVSAFAFSLFISPLFLLISEINKNYSQVDRCWSLLPTLYNAHYVLYAHLAGLPTQRLDNLIAVSTVWSVSGSFQLPGNYT